MVALGLSLAACATADVDVTPTAATACCAEHQARWNSDHRGSIDQVCFCSPKHINSSYGMMAAIYYEIADSEPTSFKRLGSSLIIFT